MEETEERRGWFRSIENRRTRVIAQLAAFVVLCAAIGVTWGLASEKALGAPQPTAQRCVTSEGEPCPAPTWAAYKFKKGKMGEARITERRIFRHPASARRAMIRKIDRALDRRARERPALRRVSARAAYFNWLRASDCGGNGTYHPYSSGFDVCVLEGPETRITTEDIQDTGTVILCGGGVVAGVLASPPTGSASWWVVGLGSMSCFWGAWISMSD